MISRKISGITLALESQMPHRLAPPMVSRPEPTLLGDPDLAKRWKVSIRTLQRKRKEGSGPPFLRIGGQIRYRLEDVLLFEDCMIAPGKDL